MSILIWDNTGDRLYETGVKMGVLYPQSDLGTYPLGVAWSGLTAVTEKPSGADSSPVFADDIKYLSLMAAEEFGATVEAYTYPDEFGICDGSAELAIGVIIGQQKRKPFGLAYRTTLGNDVMGNEYGYKLHVIYGATAAPSEKGYATVNDKPEAITFSWDLTTTPVTIVGFKPTASIVIDSTKVDAATLAVLESILFGTEIADPRLPLPNEIATLFASAAPLALALSTVSPLDEAAAVAIDANIVLTFNNAVLRESISVTSAAGAIVAGSKTWDATGKILTFNPTASLALSTTYITMVSGVVDIYGQSLDTEAKNFTTVSV